MSVAAAVFDSDALAAVAFGLFGFVAAMSVPTLWIEIDASRRALAQLRELLAPIFDERGARMVLGACGATYVASTLLDVGFFGRRLRRDEHEDTGGGGSSGDDADDALGGLFD